MVNFIIYEDEKQFRNIYVSIILKLIGGTNIAYKIVELDHYIEIDFSNIKNLIGKKIYILDIEVPGKSGLDLAREIRHSGDWQSPIIVATTHENLKNTAYNSRILMLDFISKYCRLTEDLYDNLSLSLDIVECRTNSLNFQCNGEIIQMPYSDILFIEKNVDDIYSSVVTKDGRFQIRKNISTIEKELEHDNRFFRSSRYYIVNLGKITRVELKTGIIHFENDETASLSRDKKKELKSKLLLDDVAELGDEFVA